MSTKNKDLVLNFICPVCKKEIEIPDEADEFTELDVTFDYDNKQFYHVSCIEITKETTKDGS